MHGCMPAAAPRRDAGIPGTAARAHSAARGGTWGRPAHDGRDDRPGPTVATGTWLRGEAQVAVLA
eukprot:COSAG03_NODE_19664_length_332_cov_1.115880_1_plen_64_part_10